MDYQDYVDSTAPPVEFYIPRNESSWPSVLFLDPGLYIFNYEMKEMKNKKLKGEVFFIRFFEKIYFPD